MNNKWQDLKKYFDQQFISVYKKLNDNPVFNSLKEQYQSLSLIKQSLLKYSFLTFGFLLVFIIPISYMLDSWSYLDEFKNKYEISQKLIKLKQEPRRPSFLSSYQIEKEIEKLIRKYEQNNYKISKTSTKNKKTVTVSGFKVDTDHLNIRQAVQLASELNKISFLKIESFELEESSKYPNHYNVSLGLNHFSIKQQPQKIKKRTPDKKKVNQSKSRRNLSSIESVVSEQEKDEKAFRLPAVNKNVIKDTKDTKKAFKPLSEKFKTPNTHLGK